MEGGCLEGGLVVGDGLMGLVMVKNLCAGGKWKVEGLGVEVDVEEGWGLWRGGGRVEEVYGKFGEV